MKTDNVLKLRLAARTLIEWSAPPTSGEYQHVLADLLEKHPYAKDRGLNSNSKILAIDNQGAILWYLTETLSEWQASTSLEVTSDHKQFLHHLCTDKLVDYGVLSESTLKTRTSGPSKAKIADSAIAAILSKKPDEQALGFDTVLALFVPLDFLYQRDSIQQLIIKVKTQSRVVQRLTKLVQGQYRVILFALLSVSIGSLIPILVDLWLKNNSNNATRWIDIITIIIPAIFSSLTFFVQKNETVVKTQLKKTNALLRNTKKRSTKQLSHKGKNGSTNLDISTSRKIDNFQAFIGQKCSRNPKIFASLLLAETNNAWPEIALASTKSATPDVAKEALSLIRDSKLNASLRSKIFIWLCGVKIFKDQSK